VTKDIIDINNIFKYTDQNGENQTLQYWQVQSDKNMSFDVLNIELQQQFLNATKTSATGSTELTEQIDLLQDANYINYLLFKVTNTSSLTSATWYWKQFENDVDIDVSNTYYLLYAGEINVIQGDVADYILTVKFVFTDQFANEKEIWLQFRAQSDTTYEDTVNNALVHQQNVTQSCIIQVRIQDLLDALGKSYKLVKLSKIRYYLSFKTATTISSSSYEVASMIYSALVLPQKFEINSITINHTKTISVKASRISGSLKINKIADVSIPALLDLQTYDPSRSDDKEPFIDVDSAGNYKIKYTWKFSLSDDPAIQFSNTQVNLTLPNYEGFSVANITEFIVDTQDELSTLQNYKAGDEITILSNPSVGDLHLIIMTIAYPVEIYNAIMGEGVGIFYFITHPVDAMYYIFGFILAVIFSYLKWGRGKETGEKYKAKGLPRSRKGLREA
ncbi:MAG: hypothetical protein ACP6IU_15035, partial [Candidatus Asgardarchaeia archaeon]